MVDEKLQGMIAQIAAAYFANNKVEPQDIPKVMASIETALRSDGSVIPSTGQNPAVPIDQSVTPDAIICLEDGKPMTMLKRHLKASYNMTPDQYRAKWGLPASYPMVAPNYAKKRSKIAKGMG